MRNLHPMLFACAAAGLVGLPCAGSAVPPPTRSHVTVPTQPGQRYWVFFSDKGYRTGEEQDAAIAALEGTYNPRAIERRRLRRSAPGLFDARDLPVSRDYVDQVSATG